MKLCSWRRNTPEALGGTDGLEIQRLLAGRGQNTLALPQADWGSSLPESPHRRKLAPFEQGLHPQGEGIPTFATLSIGYETQNTSPTRLSLGRDERRSWEH